MSSVVAELLRDRTLIKNLVFTDLKLEYRDSDLGFVWSPPSPVL
jgi:ABC-type polysaccharide/polyol phosphate export permease